MNCPYCGHDMWRSCESQEFRPDWTHMVVYTDAFGFENIAMAKRVHDLHVHYECEHCEAEFLWSRNSERLVQTLAPVGAGPV